MRWAQQQRLDFIGARILAGDVVNRRDLMAVFRISAPQAANDFKAFNKAHPGAMRYDLSRKAYVPHRVTTKSEDPSMFELRYVTGGPNRVLEFRTRKVAITNWGDVRHVGEWSEWRPVPEVDVNEAAMGDLIASGGLPACDG